MSTGPTRSGFKLIDVDDPGVLESLARIDAMSDEQIRELAQGEPQIMVDAAEHIIAKRHLGSPAAPHTT
jgi:hypothetical protein